ncbi:phosphonate ABC transporter ATP-binding protein [Mariprofundus sp. EBB-1]|uniref:phosphonate ABC transporter ATP-binding protein n=1 Tax=Mariprofundus sp. EBB-1 TaxID=2650971 RepID=UPI000EF1C169|nr:phosphonate ABC transporter ATP-binding protein [Mariprofundus sp. EBB-1]RLL52720.1 phosphonate ABC transporter ATP-binding protein [Mariprofundus sp. EBB-1]
MASIKINSLAKTYDNGFQALQCLSLDIDPGSFTVILGPSGAGKSTLLRTINGLETATSGTVCVSNLQVNKQNLKSIREHVAMVFQQFNLVSRLSVMTNVLTGRLAKRHSLLSLLYLFPKEDYAIALKALERVGLEEKVWHRADKLSGGQQQRVGIARALAQEPLAIIADEPVASLDPRSSKEVLTLLRDICREMNITVVASLHQVDFAREYADRIIGMNAGRIVFDGPPSAFTSSQEISLYQHETMEVKEDAKMALAYA